MVTRIKIVLPPQEYSALLKLAELDLRSPDEEMRYVLRLELQARGLLSADGVRDNLAITHQNNVERSSNE